MKLTEAEVGQIELDPAEAAKWLGANAFADTRCLQYSESGWYSIQDIASDGARYHPALRVC